MKFIIKHSQDIKPQMAKKSYNKQENEKVMNTQEKIMAAEAILNDAPRNVKRVKKDKGLIERTESSTIVLTEDNKQLLND